MIYYCFVPLKQNNGCLLRTSFTLATRLALRKKIISRINKDIACTECRYYLKGENMGLSESAAKEVDGTGLETN